MIYLIRAVTVFGSFEMKKFTQAFLQTADLIKIQSGKLDRSCSLILNLTNGLYITNVIFIEQCFLSNFGI